MRMTETLLFAMLALISYLALLAFGQAERPLVGAIRWDAWHSSKGGPGLAVEHSLGPERYHWRLPFFAVVRGEDDITVDGTTQPIMDTEITWAAWAGLDYWAFVMYQPDTAMSLALDLYLASEKRSLINFAMISGPDGLDEAAKHSDRLFELMARPTYQRVAGGRPLYFVGFLDQKWLDAWGGEEGVKAVGEAFRARATEYGLPRPYLVVMDFNPTEGERWRKLLGADAISSYATSAADEAAPYSKLTEYTENFWERCLATGAQVVPTVMSGWDRRPRIERPVPWEASYQQPGVGMERYYEAPTPSELTAHLGRALDWIEAHPDNSEPNCALIYAWNENDEGGWLVPTLSEGPARLVALHGLLRPDSEAPEPALPSLEEHE